MRLALVATLILASACSLQRGTEPAAQPQKSALSKCYDEACARPLFVVDGKRLFESNVDLNPSDIVTVEVVKGPSAVAAYGEDARNGVIVITTKRGPPTRD
jgi:TonB-dependent SusC/RagA subfamily outer membrane receptor